MRTVKQRAEEYIENQEYFGCCDCGANKMGGQRAYLAGFDLALEMLKNCELSGHVIGTFGLIDWLEKQRGFDET